MRISSVTTEPPRSVKVGLWWTIVLLFQNFCRLIFTRNINTGIRDECSSVAELFWLLKKIEFDPSRHSSFSNPSVAPPTWQLILQPFFRFSYVTGSSLTSPGEPPMERNILNKFIPGLICVPLGITGQKRRNITKDRIRKWYNHLCLE